MLAFQRRRLGTTPAMASNPYENIDGIDVRDRDAVYERLRSQGLLDPIGEPPQPQEQPAPTTALPRVPPSVRSTDPWARANVRRTLLDLSAAFGGAQNFGEGLGRAASSLGNRMDQLQAEATPQRRAGVGPDGTFEAVTDPVTGQTTYQRIPEFQRAAEEERAAAIEARRPIRTPEDILEERSRVLASIQQLPTEAERQIAYRRLIANPEAFGGIDTNGMPVLYDPLYTATIAGAGMTAQQAELLRLRQEDLERKREADRVRQQQGQQRIQQGDRRISQSPANRPRSSPKPPAGFILD